jgi:hypothetical protein
MAIIGNNPRFLIAVFGNPYTTFAVPSPAVKSAFWLCHATANVPIVALSFSAV